MSRVEEKTLPKARTATREARRQQLINATIDSIAKHGLSGTTLRSVTNGANLSHGIVNFYFDSKETLYNETLGYLAKEHYDLWHNSMLKAGPEPEDQLAAIIKADFHRKTCSNKKLAVWFAFWGQLKFRPNYLKIHYQFDEERFAEIVRLCTEIAASGEYTHLEPERIARGIESLIDGLWLNLLLYPKATNRAESCIDAFAVLAELFPRHFARPNRN